MKRLASVLLILLVLAFGYFVWPTPYRYMVTDTEVFRVNRFTGEIQRIRNHPVDGFQWRSK